MTIEERIKLTELRQLIGFCMNIPVANDQPILPDAWRLQLMTLAKRADDILDEVTKD